MQHQKKTGDWSGEGNDESRIAVDITLLKPGHSGLDSTLFVKERLTASDAEPLSRLVLLVKELLSQKQLNTPWGGGLGSYGVFLLCLSCFDFIQGERGGKKGKARRKLSQKARTINDTIFVSMVQDLRATTKDSPIFVSKMLMFFLYVASEDSRVEQKNPQKKPEKPPKNQKKQKKTKI